MLLTIALASILFVETVVCFFMSMALVGVYKIARKEMPHGKQSIEIEVMVNADKAHNEILLLQKQADNLLQSMRAVNDMAEIKDMTTMVDPRQYVKEKNHAG